MTLLHEYSDKRSDFSWILSLSRKFLEESIVGCTRLNGPLLPHAHSLLWMLDKIRRDHIDLIISAEIPDPESDPELHYNKYDTWSLRYPQPRLTMHSKYLSSMLQYFNV